MDFVRFVIDMDRCWLESRFDDLGAFLADDVVFTAPGGHRIEGLAAATASYHGFMTAAEVLDYEPGGHVVTPRGDAAVVEYGWRMTWRSDGASHDDTGREILVLTRRDGAWRVVWRTQLPA